MRRSFTLISYACLVLLAACQGNEKAMVTVEVPAGFAAENLVERIVLQVTAPDMTPITDTLLPPFTSNRTFNLQVPVGTERFFTVTAILSTTPTAGFIGSAISDIDKGLHTIPVTMNFVNFAEDLPDDGLNGNPIDHPELMDVAFERDNIDALCSQEDAVFIDMRLDSNFNNFPIGPRFIIEFDHDADATTGSQSSFIEQTIAKAGVNLPTAFSQGTERFILIDADNRSPNGIARLELHEIFEDNSITLLLIGPQRPLFEAGYDSTLQILTLCIAESLFNELKAGIDDDGLGLFNVLTGHLNGTGQFLPNDMAYTNGAIIYDFSFSTSGL